MRSSGLEPESYPWKGQILPLYYERMILRAPIVLRARNFIFGTYVKKKIEKKKRTPNAIRTRDFLRVKQAS